MASYDKATQKRVWRSRAAFRKKSRGKLRLSVFRSSKHIYAQIIDDVEGSTLASASSVDKELRGKVGKGASIDAAAEVGKALAARAKDKGIAEVAFDRGAYKYHGRVKALADGAREGGLTF